MNSHRAFAAGLYSRGISLENCRLGRERGDVRLARHGDLDCKLFQALDEVACQLVRLDPVHVVRYEFAIGAFGCEHTVHTHQDAMAYGHKHSCLTRTGGQATKPEGMPGPAVEGRGGPTVAVGTGMVVRVCDDSQPERLSVRSLRAKVKKSLELRTLWR